MVEERRQLKGFRWLRLSLMLLGVTIIALVIGAHLRGIMGGGITLGKISVVLAGLGMVLLGWLIRPQDIKDRQVLARRMANLYQGAAILVLNTLLLLAGLELGARAWPQLAGRLSSPTEINSVPLGAAIPYYQSQDWGRQYWADFSRYDGEFRPYMLWRGVPLASPTINIDEQGLRQTPGIDCSAGVYKVFVFGGSTMWGDGSPDWGTIPAYLQPGLQTIRGEPVCIINFAQPGFVSTQSVVTLLTELYEGNIPDLVIFYDGINDVFGAYRSGQVGAHLTPEEIARQFNGNHLVKYVENSATFKLLQRLASNPQLITYETRNIPAGALAEAVVKAYFGNYRVVEALAQYYQFDYLFFFQPALPLGKKPLTPLEQMIKDEIDPALVSLYRETYHKARRDGAQYQHFYDISDVLDGQTTLLWFDAYHIIPEGNQRVADRMLEIISEKLERNEAAQTE